MDQTYAPIGGDFGKIFEHQDFLTMISIPDEATCILRGHLILEEVLNLWSSKITGTEDLYSGVFVPFKTKLVISKNLGLNNDIYRVLNKVNDIRNRFSHRKSYKLEISEIEALKNIVDPIIPSAKVQKVEKTHLFSGGVDQNGERKEIIYEWESGDNRIKFMIIFMALIFKLTVWIQSEFDTRGIQYNIIEFGKANK